MKDYGQESETRMGKTIEALQKELSRVRTGRANTSLVEGIKVECYGSQSPLNQIAAIAVPDPKTIAITAWDKNLVGAVEKAIQSSDLGLTPMRDRNIIRLPIPPLTEERRKELAKQCGRIGEDAKVSIRNIRRDIIDEIKKAEKDKELPQDDSRKEQDKVQKTVDKMVKQVDEILEVKQKEIMSV